MKESARLRFGNLTFDRQSRELFRGPWPVHLTPKAFRLLELLLLRRPEALSKADLQEALWPGVFVSQTSLTVLVKDLRKAIGQDATEGAPIRTVFGFGYAFTGDVVEALPPGPPSRGHVLVWGKQEMALAPGENLIGRKREAAVWVTHPSVSREHARILAGEGGAEMEDLGSKNGTFRGSQRVRGRVKLANGDEVRFGDVRLTYFGPDANVTTGTLTAQGRSGAVSTGAGRRSETRKPSPQ